MFVSILTTLSQGMVGVLVTGFALVFMGLALIKMNGTWMMLAALLTVPYTYTSGDWSGVLLLMRLLPLTQLISVLFIEKEETLLAWLCAMPTFVVLGYSFYDILFKQSAFQLLIN